MFGIGLPELLLIMGLGLIVLGPDKLPDLAKQLAKGMIELKRTANSLKDSLQEELKDEDGNNPLIDDLNQVGGQPWRGLDGKGVDPSAPLPEGFDEYGVINTASPGSDFEGVNGPVRDTAVAAEAPAATDQASADEEQVAGEEAAPQVADVADESRPEAAKTPDNQEESVA